MGGLDLESLNWIVFSCIVFKIKQTRKIGRKVEKKKKSAALMSVPNNKQEAKASF